MAIKRIIKSSFVGKYLISELHHFESIILPKLISDERAIKKYYHRLTGRMLDLSNPQSFCEKLNWYKLTVRDPQMIICADKYGVREYVTSKGYGDILNECFAVYTNVNDIKLDELPEKFVIKAAHGSHMQFIVKDKRNFDLKKAKALIRSWLRQDIYWSGREWAYKDVPHRIIVEKYLEDEHGELRDYKFFCFHGEPVWFQYDIGRYTGKAYRNYYDMEMNLQPFNDGTPSKPDEKPAISEENFERMKKIASDLSSDFQQVRVDFYETDGKVYVGEMTFYDGGGSTIFTPDEWNYTFSEAWKVTTEQGHENK